MMDGVFVSLPAPFNEKLCGDIYNNTQYKKLGKSISVLTLRNIRRFITIQHSSLHRFAVWNYKNYRNHSSDSVSRNPA